MSDPDLTTCPHPSITDEYCDRCGCPASTIVVQLHTQLAAVTAESEGRLKVLKEKAEEMLREWVRAERAECCVMELEAELARLRADAKQPCPRYQPRRARRRGTG